MSIKETVLRYELPAKTKAGRTLVAANDKRLKDHLKWLEDVHLLKKIKTLNRKVEFQRQSDETMERHNISNAREQCNMETQKYARATITVRRRAMEIQQQKDMEQCHQELSSLSKTIYKEHL